MTLQIFYIVKLYVHFFFSSSFIILGPFPSPPYSFLAHLPFQAFVSAYLPALLNPFNFSLKRVRPVIMSIKMALTNNYPSAKLRLQARSFFFYPFTVLPFRLSFDFFRVSAFVPPCVFPPLSFLSLCSSRSDFNFADLYFFHSLFGLIYLIVF